MKLVLSLVICTVCAFSVGTRLAADDIGNGDKSFLYVDQLVHFSGRFTEAYLFFQWDNSLCDVLPAYAVDEHQNEERSLRLAARVNQPSGYIPREGHFSFVVIDAFGHRLRTPMRTLRWSELQERTMGVDRLRDFVSLKRDELKLLESQIRIQEEGLERLRSDAEVIGRLKSLVRLKDEVDLNQRNMEFLARDQAALDEFLRLARTRVTPSNFNAREAQLSKATAELAERAKRAEASGKGSRAKVDQDLQEKIKLVEKYRSVNLEALQRDVLLLRKRVADKARQVSNQASSTPSQ